jgi:aspartokinase
MLVVQKFGGTSVGDVMRIKNVVSIIADEMQCGNAIIVVVSAMAGVTNYLISLCNDAVNDSASDSSDIVSCRSSEYDAVVSGGEGVSAGLLSMALNARGIKSCSMQGWQVPILTYGKYGESLVKSIDMENILHCIDNGIVPVIAGFQGVRHDTSYPKITTLGRGGSDITAVAISAAIVADRCDIYTDVDGVYTADPRIVHNAELIDRLCYSDMLEIAGAGAKVLHPRAVEIAANYKIPVRIISTFTKKCGTTIMDMDNAIESRKVTGVTLSKHHVILIIQVLSGDENPGYTEESFAVARKMSGEPVFSGLPRCARNDDNTSDDPGDEVSKVYTEETSAVARKMSGELAEHTLVCEHKRILKFDDANVEVSKVAECIRYIASQYSIKQIIHFDKGSCFLLLDSISGGKLETLVSYAATTFHVFVSVKIGISCISIVGNGIKNDHDIMSKVVDMSLLSEISHISTTEAGVSMLLQDSDAEQMLRLLHNTLQI